MKERFTIIHRRRFLRNVGWQFPAHLPGSGAHAHTQQQQVTLCDHSSRSDSDDRGIMVARTQPSRTDGPKRGSNVSGLICKNSRTAAVWRILECLNKFCRMSLIYFKRSWRTRLIRAAFPIAGTKRRRDINLVRFSSVSSATCSSICWSSAVSENFCTEACWNNCAFLLIAVGFCDTPEPIDSCDPTLRRGLGGMSASIALWWFELDLDRTSLPVTSLTIFPT
mmetsp:Transcript_21591/g.40324  ORF Transcript_21591/g.40324 Transcript_21591/m.40324 type:complete len:223 (-) Transcript_21591:2-670(-)